MSTFMFKNTNLNFTPVSNVFIEKYMPNARGEFVKVYLLMLKHSIAGEPGISAPILASSLNLLESDIMNALNYWSDLGHKTEHRTAGCLFIGTYDLESQTEILGHVFSSRPSKIHFQYRFYSYNNESAKAYAIVYDTEKNEIGQGELLISNSTNDYKLGELLMDYSLLKKAAHITIVFLSSSSDSPSTKDVQGSDGAFQGYGDSRHIGNVLTVDDIELIYE